MGTITFEDFMKLDIRIAKIVAVGEIEGADKLLKLTLDVGDEDEGGLGERTIAAGIKESYEKEDLVGKLIPYLSNLAPRTIRGVISQGMILAAGADEVSILHPDKDIKPGSKIR